MSTLKLYARGRRKMEQTYTQQTKKLLDYLRETQQRHSSMLSYMELETGKLAASLMEASLMGRDSKPSSSETPQLSVLLETEYKRLRSGAGLEGLTEEESLYAQAMRRLIRYFKEQGR